MQPLPELRLNSRAQLLKDPNYENSFTVLSFTINLPYLTDNALHCQTTFLSISWQLVKPLLSGSHLLPDLPSSGTLLA